MSDPRENIIHDKDGVEWEVLADGSRRVPQNSHPLPGPSNFTEYDSSRGHCPLCGRLTCNGGCFK